MTEALLARQPVRGSDQDGESQFSFDGIELEVVLDFEDLGVHGVAQDDPDVLLYGGVLPDCEPCDQRVEPSVGLGDLASRASHSR